MPEKVLVIEPDPEFRNTICNFLASNGFVAEHVSSGSDALMQVGSGDPSLILTALDLPDMDGKDMIRSLRKWSLKPAIVISRRHCGSEKARAFDSGADDYLSKPYDEAELLARIKNALRHHRQSRGFTVGTDRGIFENGDLRIDFEQRRVFFAGNEVKLTLNEYVLLSVLAKFAGKVLTREYLINCVWGSKAKNDCQLLRVNMGNLRRKIEPFRSKPMYISTEQGIGYKMNLVTKSEIPGVMP